jgi:hypothetical protein
VVDEGAATRRDFGIPELHYYPLVLNIFFFTISTTSGTVHARCDR